MQDICSHSQKYLCSVDDRALVIADSRNKPKNAGVSHSIFTQKYKAGEMNMTGFWKCQPLATAKITPVSNWWT